MHRLILGLPDAVHGDHANGDGLDNQRENLRPATVRQNMANRRRQKGAKNPYCGVERLPSGRFRAKWKDGERYVHGGVFSTPEEAAAVRDAAVRRIHGEYAWTNFPTK